jgi:hypothetical protein
MPRRLSAQYGRVRDLPRHHSGMSRDTCPGCREPEHFTCHHVRERASDLRKRGRRPSFVVPGGGIQNTVRKSVVTAIGRKLVTSANVFGGRPSSKSAGNAPVSSGSRRRAGRTHRGADLSRYQGGGYAMTSDLQAIAIEQRWCQSCPSGNLPTAGLVPWLGSPALMRPPGWRELRRKTCVCGNLHRAGAMGHVFARTASDLRRSRKAFRFRRRFTRSTLTCDAEVTRWLWVYGAVFLSWFPCESGSVVRRSTANGFADGRRTAGRPWSSCRCPSNTQTRGFPGRGMRSVRMRHAR